MECVVPAATVTFTGTVSVPEYDSAAERHGDGSAPNVERR